MSLVARLREYQVAKADPRLSVHMPSKTIGEAADEIERLQAECKGLAAQLEDQTEVSLGTLLNLGD